MISHRAVLGLVLLTSFVLVGCQSRLDVQHQLAESYDPQNYATFVVASLDGVDNKNRRLLESSMRTVLENKGYRYGTAEDADLLFIYDIDLTEDSNVTNEVVMRDGKTFNVPKIEAVFQAHILINAIEPQSHQVVWKAATDRDLRNVDLKHIDQKRLLERLELLFESLPDRD